MDLFYESSALEKSCTQWNKAVKKYGEVFAKLIFQRLNEMRAAPNLEVLAKLPGPHCHPLKGNRQGQFSVRLSHPYRLIFEPTEDHSALNNDGGYDWKRVTSVVIKEVKVDTHDRKDKRRR